MKKGSLVLAITLWTIIAVAIVSIAIFASNGRTKGSMNNMILSAKLLKSEEISLGDTRNIIIECTSQNIKILKTNEERIKVSQYGNPDTSKEDLFLVSTSNDSIKIYINRKFYTKIFNINTYEERLVVEIPEKYYDELNASASSGSIKIEDGFDLKNLKLNTSSGSIRTSMSIKANEHINLKASSGSINIDNDISAKDLYVNTSSGSISMSNVYVDRYDLLSTSGSIKITSISGEGNANASSGSISLILNNPKGDINVITSSGSIKIGLDQSVHFTLVALTSSGSIKGNFPLEKNERGNHATANIGDNPTVNIKANASSGSIKVEH